MKIKHTRHKRKKVRPLSFSWDVGLVYCPYIPLMVQTHVGGNLMESEDYHKPKSYSPITGIEVTCGTHVERLYEPKSSLWDKPLNTDPTKISNRFKVYWPKWGISPKQGLTTAP